MIFTNSIKWYIPIDEEEHPVYFAQGTPFITSLSPCKKKIATRDREDEQQVNLT